MDYADQRYYSTILGRFLTPDRAAASNALVIPQNWNRYAYVGGDPVNKTDPEGVCSPQDDPPRFSVTKTENGGNDNSRQSPVGPAAGNPNANSDLNSGPNLRDEYIGGGAFAGIGEIVSIIRDPNSTNTTKVQGGLVRLRAVLSGHVDCMKFLQSGIAGGTPSVFKTCLVNGLAGSAIITTSSGTANAITATGGKNYGTGFVININANGAYFNSSVGLGVANKYATSMNSLVGGTQPAQNFLLIHELAHYFQTNGFNQTDSSDAAQKANNDLIWKNCEQSIRGGGAL